MSLFILCETAFVSTLLYYFLHKKTRISLKYLYIDNVVVILITFFATLVLNGLIDDGWRWIIYPFVVGLVVATAFAITMLRFWRTPSRKIPRIENEIISPADGNIIYIKRVEKGEEPISIKGKRFSRLTELTKTDLLDEPCWLIGINMTPFDVHKNCAPIDGRIVLNQHFDGKFLSLKDMNALTENERNTYVIQNDHVKVGIVQIASRLVRRIDSYVKSGTHVRKGDWLGMIRFGSQVDVLLPVRFEVLVDLKEQVYAGTTVIARERKE